MLERQQAGKGEIIDRLFSFLLFIAFSYQMIHNSHATNEALVKRTSSKQGSVTSEGEVR